jgi:hypothetical protein
MPMPPMDSRLTKITTAGHPPMIVALNVHFLAHERAVVKQATWPRTAQLHQPQIVDFVSEIKNVCCTVCQTVCVPICLTPGLTRIPVPPPQEEAIRVTFELPNVILLPMLMPRVLPVKVPHLPMSPPMPVLVLVEFPLPMLLRALSLQCALAEPIVIIQKVMRLRLAHRLK